MAASLTALAARRALPRLASARVASPRVTSRFLDRIRPAWLDRFANKLLEDCCRCRPIHHRNLLRQILLLRQIVRQTDRQTGRNYTGRSLAVTEFVHRCVRAFFRSSEGSRIQLFVKHFSHRSTHQRANSSTDSARS